jgi:hypothetical protein
MAIGRRARVLGRRGIVVLAEPRGGVAVAEQDAANRRVFRADVSVVAGVTGRELGDHAEADLVVVAPSDERGAGRRAERGRVELGIAQPRLGDAVQRRGRDDAAERAADAVALVVGHDEKHVGRAPGRHDARRPPGRRFLSGLLDDASELRRRRRQLLPVDGCRGVRRAQLAGSLRRGARGGGRSGLRLGRGRLGAEPGAAESAR